MRPFVLVVVTLFVAGVFWQTVASTGDERANPVRGVFADAGGHRLRLVPTGRDRPAPTVLLETGIGGATSATWAWVQRGVEPFAPVVSYDRAGLGASDPGPLPRDGMTIVRELHAALGSAGLGPPYVFVGHSFGGLIARLFTAQYPGEVAGVVLVESSIAGPVASRRRAPPWFRVAGLGVAVAPWAARLGIVRAIVHLFRTDADLLPPRERAEQKAFLSGARQWRGVKAEWDSWGSRTAPEAGAVTGFGSKPLAILTAGEHAAGFPGWVRAQDALMSLSTDSIHRTEPGATHGSLVADSAHAQAIVRAIHEVVESARTHRPLREIAARL